MAKGDHLIVRRDLYFHHGIDLGDGQVAHFGGGLKHKHNATVEIVSREQFSGGQEVTTVDSPALFGADEIVRRAYSRVGEADYHVIDNNCEHFANWCRHGRAHSTQSQTSLAIARAGLASTARMMLRKVVSASAAAGSRPVAAMIATRGLAPALIAADVTQLAVETIAFRRGAQSQLANRLGERAGILTSGAIGMTIGGPGGAAVGIGYWMLGQRVGTVMLHSLRRFR